MYTLVLTSSNFTKLLYKFKDAYINMVIILEIIENIDPFKYAKKEITIIIPINIKSSKFKLFNLKDSIIRSTDISKSNAKNKPSKTLHLFFKKTPPI